MTEEFEVPMSPEAGQAMQALADCTVIRSRIWHRGFCELLMLGVVTMHPVRDRIGFADWRLDGEFAHIGSATA